MVFPRVADTQGLALVAGDEVDTGIVAYPREETRKSRGATHGEVTLAPLLRRAPRASRALPGRRGLCPARTRPPHPRRARAAVSDGCVLRDRPQPDPRLARQAASLLRPGAMFAMRAEGSLAPVIGMDD